MQKVAKLYSSGKLHGWAGVDHPVLLREAFRMFKDSSAYMKGLPKFGDIPEHFSLHRVARQVLNRDVGGGVQEIGDPFAAGTMVTMLDGSEKPVEDIIVGEYVINHKGQKAKVTNVIKKQFTGDMVTVKVRGWHRELTATETHHGMILPYDGPRFKYSKCERRKFGEMSVDDYMLVPWGFQGTEYKVLDLADYIENGEVNHYKVKSYCAKHGSNRYIEVDRDFGYFIGLYLAEGGIATGKSSINFSLNKNEKGLIRKIYHLSTKIFGIRPTTQKTGNPNCVRVSINSRTVAEFISNFVFGNIKTKSVPKIFFQSNKYTRKALFNGWIDGDGHKNSKANAVVGYTISESLANDMARIGLSLKCKLSTRQRKRKNGDRNYSTSYEVSLYSKEIQKIINGAVLTKVKHPKVRITPYGVACKIEKITRTPVKDETVYCITTENEFTAIFNGVAQYQCVSWGMKHAAEYTQCCDILMRGDREEFKFLFAPFYYGSGRVYVGGGRLGNSDGSLGSWMAEAAIKYGSIFVDDPGVPSYSGSVAKRWGDPNPSDDLDKHKELAVKRLLTGGTKVNSFDELCNYLANGYPCTVASNQGFQMTPGRDGYHEASGNWAHQMMYFGYGPDYGLIANSWGDVHGRLKCFDKGDDLPVGTIRARKNVVERMISAGETFAFTGIEGFKLRDIPRELFRLIGRV